MNTNKLVKSFTRKNVFLRKLSKHLAARLSSWASIDECDGLHSLGETSFKDYLEREDMKARLAALTDGLDKSSLDEVKRIIWKLRNLPERRDYKMLQNIVACDADQCRRTDVFIPVEYLADEKMISDREEFELSLPKLAKKYHFLPKYRYYFSPEVFFYHHGLIELPVKVKKMLINSDILDIGAFFGDSAVLLQQYQPKCIHSFELSPSNRVSYLDTMRINNIPDEKFTLVPKAVGYSTSTLAFSDTGGHTTALNTDGNLIAETISIDEYTTGKKLRIGLIKMDIEGSELDALDGMMETIKKDRPVLSIAIYHTPEHLFEIKPFLQSKISDYVFRIRQLSFIFSSVVETTLIAYPRELDK